MDPSPHDAPSPPPGADGTVVVPRRRGWRRRRSEWTRDGTLGDDFAKDARSASPIWIGYDIVRALAFGAVVVAAGFAFFSLWLVIPTLVLAALVVVWWIRSASARRRDARREFERRHPSVIDAGSAPAADLRPGP